MIQHVTGRWRLAALVAAAAALTAPPAPAESPRVPPPLSREWAGEPPRVEDTCEPGDLRFAAAPMFRIAGGRGMRVHFFSRKQACGQRCAHQRAEYLVPGDIVLAGPEDRGFRCVAFGTRRGALTGGFIPAANLAAVEPETMLTAEWLAGTWRRDEASSLGIAAAAPGRLKIAGTGYWQGMQSRNEGAFAAEAAVAPGPTLTLRDDQCVVVLERRGPYLLANDNAACGGMNVRFVGIYIRRAAR